MIKIITLLFTGIILLSCQGEKMAPPAAVKVQAPLPAVAQLVELKPQAQVKLKTGDWHEAGMSQLFQNQDQLRTQEDASAKIDFLSGKASLKVEENSLVVIWDREEDQKKIHVIALPKGEISGTLLSDQTESLEIRTPSGWIKTNKQSEIKVSSKGITSGFKVSVLNGEAQVVTSKGSTSLKTGAEVNIISNSPNDSLLDYITSIPINSAFQKEKVFKITMPQKKEFRTKNKQMTFLGIWQGDFAVWANGKQLKPQQDETLVYTYDLVPGLNVINLQVSDPAKKNVEYHIYKITREATQ